MLTQGLSCVRVIGSVPSLPEHIALTIRACAVAMIKRHRERVSGVAGGLDVAGIQVGSCRGPEPRPLPAPVHHSDFESSEAMYPAIRS